MLSIKVKYYIYKRVRVHSQIMHKSELEQSIFTKRYEDGKIFITFFICNSINTKITKVLEIIDIILYHFE